MKILKIPFGALVLCSALLAGCAVTTQITSTPRSSIEQELLVTSLERGLASFDTQRLKGTAVIVDFYGLTPDKDFAREFFTAWLQAHQVQIVTDPKQAQLHLKVFAPVLGVDQAQSFIGAPAFTVPFLGIAIPEMPLFKDIKHSGHAALVGYTLEEDGGKFLDKSPIATGRADYDDYTVLIVLHFSKSDIGKQSWGWEPN